MADKKPVPWVAIKKRYLKGEKPKLIADDYGITSEQIRQKAKRDSWKTQKDTIEHKIEDQVFSELDEIYSVYTSLILDTGKKIKLARDTGLIGLTIQDGEGFSSKFADNDQKAGLALILEQRKHANKVQLAKMAQESKEPPQEGEVPGIHVSPDA